MTKEDIPLFHDYACFSVLARDLFNYLKEHPLEDRSFFVQTASEAITYDDRLVKGYSMTSEGIVGGKAPEKDLQHKRLLAQSVWMI